MPLLGLLVEQGQIALGVAGDHRLAQRFEQTPVHFLLLVQLQLLGLACGDVGDETVPEHRAIDLSQRCGARLDPDQALAWVVDAVLAVPRRELGGGLADAAQQGAAIECVHAPDDGREAAGQLPRAEAVDLLDPFADVGKAGAAVATPVKLEKHARHLRGDLLQAQLQLFLVGQVVGVDQVATQLFLFIVDGGDAQQHRHFATALVAQAPLGHLPAAKVQRRGEHCESRFHRHLEFAGEQLGAPLQRFVAKEGSGQRVAGQRLLAVAEQAFGGRVDAGDDAVRAGDQHGAGGAVEDRLLQCRLLGMPVRQQVLLEQADHLAAQAF